MHLEWLKQLKELTSEKEKIQESSQWLLHQSPSLALECLLDLQYYATTHPSSYLPCIYVLNELIYTPDMMMQQDVIESILHVLLLQGSLQKTMYHTELLNIITLWEHQHFFSSENLTAWKNLMRNKTSYEIYQLLSAGQIAEFCTNKTPFGQPLDFTSYAPGTYKTTDDNTTTTMEMRLDEYYRN